MGAKFTRDDFIELMTTDKRTPQQRCRERYYDEIRYRYSNLATKWITHKRLSYRLKKFFKWHLLRRCHFEHFRTQDHARADAFVTKLAERRPLVITAIDEQEQHCMSPFFYHYNLDSGREWKKYFTPLDTASGGDKRG